jgi:hypothetical protein
MAKVMRQTKRLGEIFIQPERASNCAANLGHLNTVRQTDPEMIPVRRDEDLRLVSQPSKRDGMDDPVSVALKCTARPPNGSGGFRIKSAPALIGVAG